jgi:hypothetical protein
MLSCRLWRIVSHYSSTCIRFYCSANALFFILPFIHFTHPCSGFSFNAVTDWTSSHIKPDARPDGTYPSVFTSKIGAKFSLAGFIPSSPVYLKLLSAGYASNNELATAFSELPSNLNSPESHEVKLRVRCLLNLLFAFSPQPSTKNHCRLFRLLTCFHLFAGHQRLASR